MFRILAAFALMIGIAVSANADAVDFLKAAMAARNRGDLDAAIGYYSQAIATGELGRFHATVLNSRGVAYDLKGDTDKAIVDFDAAVRLKPDYGEAFINRGLAWVQKRDYERAIYDFTAATRDAQFAYLAFSNRGNTFAVRGEYASALRDYEEAIRLRPEYPGTYDGRARVYIVLGEADKAIADFDSVLRLNPRNASIFGSRAFAYQSKGEYDRAIADLNEGIRLAPYDAKLYFMRALAWFYADRIDSALQDFGTAVRLRPSDAYGVIWLHLARVRAGHDDRRELSQNAANIDRAAWPGLVVDWHLGLVSHRMVSEAGTVEQNGEARRKRACDVQFYLATFDLEEGARDEAQQHLRTAADICPAGTIESLAAGAELKKPLRSGEP